MASSGKILGRLEKISPHRGDFEWLLYDCYDDIVQTDYYMDSPAFSFSGCSWNIRLYTKGLSAGSEKWIALYLMRKGSDFEQNVTFSLCLEVQGYEVVTHGANHTFKEENTDEGWGWPFFVLKEDVLDGWSPETKVPLKLFVQISFTVKIPSDEDIQKDFESSYRSGIDVLRDVEYDLVLKVKDTYFKAHHHVLVSRCPDFMLAHGMLERNRHVVEIPDCDPADFGQFLVYAYTGDILRPNEEVIPPLYHIAVKYDMGMAKQRCCELIKKSLSPHNVCDVMRLASKNDDSSLRQMAGKYIFDNAKEIATAEWQSFINEKPSCK